MGAQFYILVIHKIHPFSIGLQGGVSITHWIWDNDPHTIKHRLEVEESQHKRLLELVELEESQLHAHQIIELFQVCQKIWSDKKVRPQKFQERNLVMVYGSHYNWKTFKKLLSKWFGPYVIMNFLYIITHELAHLDREKYRMINHDKIKHFHSG